MQPYARHIFALSCILLITVYRGEAESDATQTQCYY